MTPSDLEVLIHCYVSPNPHPRLEAPAVQDSIRDFLMADVIYQVTESTYRTTKRGEMWLKMMLDTPMPVYQLVDPREIQE